MKVRKLVLFDIDGTLLLTAGAGRRAIVAAIGEEL
jgi:phosphoglycolate phosphatase-like HAD superfamily hydrolase